jgi:hypothetical protein
LVSALAHDKAPSRWGRKLIVTNPEGMTANVSLLTAGNTALELAMVMNIVEDTQDLVKFRWGGGDSVQEGL